MGAVHYTRRQSAALRTIPLCAGNRQGALPIVNISKRYPLVSNRRLTPYLLLTLTVLFWSGNFVLGRGIRESIPPMSLNFWRWAGALLILLPVGLPRIYRQRALMCRHWRFITLMSIPSIAIFNACIYQALQTTTTTNTVLVNAMLPVFIAVTAWMGFRDRLSARQAGGVGVSLLGLVFIVTRGHLEDLGNLTGSTGDIWTLVAGISWALYSVYLRKRPTEMDPIGFLTAMIFSGLLFLLPFYLWEIHRVGGFALNLKTSASLGYVAVFPSVLSYIFWNQGVRMVGPNRAGIFFHLMPVFSVAMAIAFLGEQLQIFHVWGVLLIFTGIVLTTVPDSGWRQPTAMGR